MPDDTATARWTISVSKDTDAAVRSHLAQRGLAVDDLSAFVEDAVRWRVLDQTIAEVREKLTDLSEGELTAIVDEAVAAARAAGPEGG